MAETSKQLQEIVRTGVQHILKLALEAEINQFIRSHNDLAGEDGLKQIVRNGYHRVRSVKCGIGSIEVSVPRSRDRRKNVARQTVFQSRIIPRYLRRVDALDALIPQFYLKGLKTGDFSDVFSLLLDGAGEDGEEILSTSWVKWLEDQWKRDYYDRYEQHDRYVPHDQGWGDGDWFPWIFIGLGGDGEYFSSHSESYGWNKAPTPIDGLPKINTQLRNRGSMDFLSIEQDLIATSGQTYRKNGYDSGSELLFSASKPIRVPTASKKPCRWPIGKNFSKSFFKMAS
ncbi:MAG: hypothetical protein GY940_17780 [bacterium]|nr:hypothetical protein [bacterium]